MIDNIESHVFTATTGAVRTLTFNRPAKKNAFTLDMYARLADALGHASGDPAVRVVVLTGAGDCFTGGNDVNDVLNHPDMGPDPPTFRFLRALAEFPKPLLAAVNGAAVGIGTTMLMHCDLVWAAEGALFSMPFTKLGLCPEAGSSLLLPRLAGLHRAAELLLLGEPFDARRAYEVGLVNGVVPGERLLELVAERAAALAALPPASVRVSKELIRHELRQRLRDAMEREGRAFRERLVSPEAREALTAFLEKRDPDFSRFR
jgi:enoyl-CoA hydratase/carnithine racemase